MRCLMTRSQLVETGDGRPRLDFFARVNALVAYLCHDDSSAGVLLRLTCAWVPVTPPPRTVRTRTHFTPGRASEGRWY